MEQVWRPNQRQADFLALPDTVFEALYGGAAGGGKSEVLLLLPIVREFFKVRGFKGAIFRRTYPELEKEVILRAPSYYRPTGGIYNDQKKRWHWPQYDSYLQFGYAEHEQDVRKYDTIEYNYLGFDELTSFTEFMYMYLAFSRVRSIDGNLPPIVRSASNPGNVGHGFVRSRFIEPACVATGAARDGYAIIVDKHTKQKRIWIPAKATDNTALMKADPQYVNRLQMLPEAERRAKLDGDWWTFSGQVFEDWRIEPFPDEPPNACHVVEPFDIPDYWPRVLGIDWGYQAMLWAGWAAISPESRIYIYREYARTKTKIAEWAADIARLSANERLVDVVLDPSAWGNRGDAYTIAQQFEHGSGLRPRPADNDRIGGKSLIQELLRWRAKPSIKVPVNADFYDHEHYQFLYRTRGEKAAKIYLEAFAPAAGETNLPKLQVFNTCIEFIRAIPLCVFDEKRVEDVAEFKGDDPYDGGRYLLKAAMRYIEGNKAESEHQAQVARICSDFERTGDATTFHHRMDLLDKKRTPRCIVRRGFHGGRRYVA